MKYIYTIILIIIFSAISTFAQKSNGSIEGTLYDSAQGGPVDFANIILFDQSDSSQVSGTTTNEKGLFTLLKVKPGRYFLEARFIGYANKSIDDIIISPSNSSINLGNIPMEQTVIQVEGVAIEAERAAITYDIDRKVIDVSKMQTAVSGSAVEVLENVPSVTVDIEGNVALRGSSNFTLLINGRPTVLDANDALQQTPASSIDKIEVISNPSSKYDPDGTSGIINLQLKKNQDLGRSALINLNGGVNNKYGGDILYQHKTKNIN